MAIRARKETATVGVADHCGWAVLVTVASNCKLVDRRRVELVDGALPKLPHHHEAQSLPVDEAVALVERVRRSAHAFANACLETLAAGTSMPIAAIALRECPPLPATVPERLANYRAQNVADSVMYREALVQAAQARGWSVHWYDARRVLVEAARALGRRTIEDLLTRRARRSDRRGRRTTGWRWPRPWRRVLGGRCALNAPPRGAASGRFRMVNTAETDAAAVAIDAETFSIPGRLRKQGRREEAMLVSSGSRQLGVRRWYDDASANERCRLSCECIAVEPGRLMSGLPPRGARVPSAAGRECAMLDREWACFIRRSLTNEATSPGFKPISETSAPTSLTSRATPRCGPCGPLLRTRWVRASPRPCSRRPTSRRGRSFRRSARRRGSSASPSETDGPPPACASRNARWRG